MRLDAELFNHNMIPPFLLQTIIKKNEEKNNEKTKGEKKILKNKLT